MTGETGRRQRLVACDTAAEAEAAVAQHAIATVAADPEAVVGLATGRSMVGVYRHIVNAHRKGLSLRRITTFNLDEYCGPSPRHPALFRNVMHRHLFDLTDIDVSRTHFPSATEGGGAYEERIRAAGGIALLLLGIGRNGHIAFNEPGSTATSRTRVVALEAETRAANAADFPGEEPPTHAITMGIATILDARRIVLIATGEAKAHALAAALEGPQSPDLPASFLQRHPATTFVCDRDAAGLLSGRGADA